LNVEDASLDSESARGVEAHPSERERMVDHPVVRANLFLAVVLSGEADEGDEPELARSVVLGEEDRVEREHEEPVVARGQVRRIGRVGVDLVIALSRLREHARLEIRKAERESNVRARPARALAERRPGPVVLLERPEVSGALELDVLPVGLVRV